MDAGSVAIACGGGGIPVFLQDRHHLKGAPAVIDKDLASELLAELLDADILIILTAVEKVAVNFGKPDQQWLDRLTPAEALVYAEEGQFAPGSMLPKVQAAVKFAQSKPGRAALITLLERAIDGHPRKNRHPDFHVNTFLGQKARTFLQNVPGFLSYTNPLCFSVYHQAYSGACGLVFLTQQSCNFP